MRESKIAKLAARTAPIVRPTIKRFGKAPGAELVLLGN
jgi:hypothetical protein